MGRRNAWRDYVDFFFLLRNKHITMAQIIEDAEKRFGNEFSKRLFLQQLSYTDDIQDFSVSFIKDKFTPEIISSYLQQQINQYSKSALPLKK